jgi:hypothetical protein
MVLDADDQHNLADPDAGFEWFKTRAWVPRAVADDGSPGPPVLPKWTAKERGLWILSVHALRSLVRRLKDRVPNRRTPMDRQSLSDADGVFFRYINRLRVIPRKRPREAGPQEPFSRTSFLRLGMLPTEEKVSANGQVAREMVSRPWEHYTNMDVFWQAVFYSLVSDENAQQCQGCGKVLEPSKSGRPSRRRNCPACNHLAWKKRQPRAEMHARWNEQKERQRGGNT